MAKADKPQLDQKLLDEIEADVELLILVEMMNEALQELRKEKFGEFVCH
jgi:hypothetical protein